jgi:hypothetical protein
MDTNPVILLRVTSVGPHERDLADQLASASDLQVAFLVDGRRGPIPVEARPVVALTDDAIDALGLYRTDDYAWRCGDYGVYLARAMFPHAEAFWVIEGDVRVSGDRPADFFSAMRSSEADLIVGHLSRATAQNNWWYFHGRGRNVTPYKCLFSVARISARLADVLVRTRRNQGLSYWRRVRWPNDEIFVATTAVKEGFGVSDINGIHGQWYWPEKYSYDVTIDGDQMPRDAKVQLLHSVRWQGRSTPRGLNADVPENYWPLRRRIATLLLPLLRW